MKQEKTAPKTTSIFWVPVFATVIVTPGLNSEPQILAKFTWFSLASFCYLLFYLQRGIYKLNQILLYLTSLFLLFLILGVILNHTNLSEQIFGVYGRSNGLLTYLSCMVFFVLISCVEFEALQDLLHRRVTQAGWIVLTYFYLQLLGWDPINWNQTYNVPTSTLGNPNFLSAFLAILIFAQFGNFVSLASTKWNQMKFIFGVTIAATSIFLSDSQQGILMVGIGVWILMLSYAQNRGWNLLSKCGAAFTLIFIAFVTFGAFNLGSGKFLFSQPSLAIRREYWIAGIEMIKDSPIFGNGIDSYLFQFDAHKTPSFVESYGTTLTSSSAHNVYIDIFQGSGVIAGLIYVTINLYIGLVSLRRILSGQVKLQYTVLFVMWVILQIQSLISIQNIAIAAWQWCIAGLLVAQSRAVIQAKESSKTFFYGNRFIKTKLFIQAIAVFLFIVSFLPLIQDVRFANAIKTSNGQALISLSKSFPFDSYRFNYTAQALQSARYWHWALLTARRAVIQNPRNKESWILIYESKLSTRLEKEFARKKIVQIDPFWKPD